MRRLFRLAQVMLIISYLSGYSEVVRWAWQVAGADEQRARLLVYAYLDCLHGT
jgi:hypothetical protein